MGRGAEYRPLVVLQDLDPRRDIGGVIVANLRRQVEIGGKEGGAKFGDKLFHGVSFGAIALAPEVAVKSRRVTSPVRRLMRARRVIALGIAKRLDGRHLHV